MNRNLSADTLFHFTDSVENLISILANDFYPRFCFESLEIFNSPNLVLGKKIGVPMVSFCDIMLSQIHSHSRTYGSYALGLKKEWGVNNSLTPIIYLDRNSMSLILFKKIRENLEHYNNEELFYDFVDLMRYCKTYKEIINDEEGQKREIRYYDEREWRFIPLKEMREARKSGEDKSAFRIALYPEEFSSESDLIDKQTLQEENKKIERFKLQFIPSDINYIIVKDECERLEIAKKIWELKGARFSYEEILILITKILTMENIYADI